MGLDDSAFSIDELAQTVEIRASTIRYYQSRGLLEPPRREGRHGVYGQTHLDRLRHISRLQERGFSLAAIAEIIEAEKRGDTVGALLGTAREDAGEELNALVLKAFPSEGDSAPAIQNAINLGVLRRNAEGVLELSDEQYGPLVFSILHLFIFGLSEEKAFEVWAAVSDHTSTLADVFAEVASGFAYSDRPSREDADAFLALARAADRIVSFALHAAIKQRLKDDPSSVWH